jgi:hypothetical protein
MKSRDGLKATVQFTFHLRNLQRFVATLVFMSDSKRYVETLECQTRDSSAVNALTRTHGSKLPEWSIYLLAILAAVLFVFIVLFACYANRSQKLNFQQALRKGQQYDHIPLDVMLRHQVSTNGDGEVNPIYMASMKTSPR